MRRRGAKLCGEENLQSGENEGGKMQKAILAVLIGIILVPNAAKAWSAASPIGVGYISLKDNTKVYNSSSGEETDDIVGTNFPFTAFNTAAALFGTSKIASEQEKNGRLHVQYFKNGKNSSDGDNSAWVNIGDVVKFNYCCDNNACSGIKTIFFKRSFSDCFLAGYQEAIDKKKLKAATNDDIEKLKMLLEIEKLKLEQEKLKQIQRNTAEQLNANSAGEGQPPPDRSATTKELRNQSDDFRIIQF